MGEFARLRPPVRPSGVLPPVPDVTLPRPEILGPAGGAATLEGFAFGKAELTSAHRKTLASMATAYQRLLAESPAGKVRAVGHTDAVGPEEKNEELGQERADAVRDALVDLGVEASAIETHSLGEAVPAVESDKREPANRRVELYFSSGPKLSGLLTGSLDDSSPSGQTPGPNLDPRSLDYCKIFPEECDPNRISSDIYKPIPELPKQPRRSFSEAIWEPIDKRLERGLNRIGITGKWNERLRSWAKSGAQKGAEEGLDQILDAAGAEGDVKEAASAILRSAVQLKGTF